MNNKRIQFIFLLTNGCVRVTFHQTIRTLMELNLFSKEATSKLGHDTIGANDIDLQKLFLP